MFVYPLEKLILDLIILVICCFITCSLQRDLSKDLILQLKKLLNIFLKTSQPLKCEAPECFCSSQRRHHTVLTPPLAVLYPPTLQFTAVTASTAVLDYSFYFLRCFSSCFYFKVIAFFTLSSLLLNTITLRSHPGEDSAKKLLNYVFLFPLLLFSWFLISPKELDSVSQLKPFLLPIDITAEHKGRSTQPSRVEVT